MNFTKLVVCFLGSCLLSFAFSCTKEKKGNTIWKVWYLLEVPHKFNATISYNSDKFEATQVRESININHKNYTPAQATLNENSGRINVWYATHKQSDRKLPYFIEAQFSDSTIFDYSGKKYVLMVFANDTSLIDSIQFKPTFNKITLSGEIPINF